MLSVKHNSITAKAMGLIFSLFNVASAREVPYGIPYSTCNVFFRDLPVSFFVFHSSLLTVKSIGLVVARDGFLCITKIVHIFHGAYLDYRGAFQTVLDSYCCVTS